VPPRVLLCAAGFPGLPELGFPVVDPVAAERQEVIEHVSVRPRLGDHVVETLAGAIEHARRVPRQRLCNI